MIALGNFLFRYRNGLFPLALLLLLVPSPPAFPDWRIAALAGASLVLFGQLLRATTVGLDYIIRGGREGKVYAEDLVTGGMFNHCRNPLYVGNYLGILGALMASNSLVAIAVGGIGFLVAYVAITLAEERFLRGKFGPAYDEYCASVPRFGLKPGGLGATLRDSTFHWRRLLVKEYGTMLVALAGVPLVILFTRHYRDGQVWWASRWDLGLLVVVGVLVVCYLIARWLKKSQRVVA